MDTAVRCAKRIAEGLPLLTRACNQPPATPRAGREAAQVLLVYLVYAKSPALLDRVFLGTNDLGQAELLRYRQDQYFLTGSSVRVFSWFFLVNFA